LRLSLLVYGVQATEAIGPRSAAPLLDSFSYESVLERGVALIRDRLGHVVTSVRTLRPGMSISVYLADGKAERPPTVAEPPSPSDTAERSRSGDAAVVLVDDMQIVEELPHAVLP
jgi:hypothetical protein